MIKKLYLSFKVYFTFKIIISVPMKKITLLLLVFATCLSSFAQKRKSGASYVKLFDIKPVMPLEYKSRTIIVTVPELFQNDHNIVKLRTELQTTCLTQKIQKENPFIKAELITSEITPRYDVNGNFLTSLKVFLVVNYEADLIIRNSSNEIIATKKLYVKGDDNMYLPILRPEHMVGILNNNLSTFQNVVNTARSDLNDRTIEKAKTELIRYFCGVTTIDTLNIYSGKGKLYDYTELDAAQDLMKLTTKDIGLKKEDTVSTKKNLLSLIEIWKKEIATADLTNPEARISQEVYRGLQYNLATAYYFLKEYKQASIHAAIARFDPTEENQKIKITNNFEKNVQDLQFLIDLNL